MTASNRAPSTASRDSRESPAHGDPGVAATPERIAAKLRDLEAVLDRANPLAEVRLAELQGLVALLAAQTASLASLSNFLQTDLEREKAALARELHDSLGGILTPAKMDLAWLEERLGGDKQFGPRMKRLAALIDQGIDLKRRIIENLRPSLLDHLGLASALQWYVDEVCRAAHLDCRLHVTDRMERLPPEVEIAFYRLAQECLANVVKHARASHVDIWLDRADGKLRLAIVDDGVGIADPGHAGRLTHGLSGMAHRVHSMNGTFDISSVPGKGTRVEILVPIAR